MMLDLVGVLTAAKENWHGSDVEYVGPNPVPEQVGFYLSPIAYGIAAFLFMALLLFLVSRLNVDR